MGVTHSEDGIPAGMDDASPAAFLRHAGEWGGGKHQSPKHMKKSSLLLVLGASILTTGCASITDGTSQTLLFNLTPSDTRCTVARDGNELGSVTGSQNTITVSKGAKDIIVNCTATGYASKTQRLVSKTQTAGVVGGLLLDFGITDMLTGAMWKYPTDVSIVMEKEKEEVPAPVANAS